MSRQADPLAFRPERHRRRAPPTRWQYFSRDRMSLRKRQPPGPSNQDSFYSRFLLIELSLDDVISGPGFQGLAATQADEASITRIRRLDSKAHRLLFSALEMNPLETTQ